MAFKALFIAHAPDGDAEKYRCVIETPKCYGIFVVVVKTQEQAIEVCKNCQRGWCSINPALPWILHTEILRSYQKRSVRMWGFL